MLEPSLTTITSLTEPSLPSSTTSTTTTTTAAAAPSTPSQATPPLVTPSRPHPPALATFAPRPGMVLDDPGYRPGQVITGPAVPHVLPAPGDIFDVTVSAHHGYGGAVRPTAYRPPYGPPQGQALPAGEYTHTNTHTLKIKMLLPLNKQSVFFSFYNLWNFLLRKTPNMYKSLNKLERRQWIKRKS